MKDFFLNIDFIEVFTFFYYFVLIAIYIAIIKQNKSPAVVISWFFILTFIPYFGVILFLYAGVNWRKRKIFKNTVESLFDSEYRSVIVKQNEIIDKLKSKKNVEEIKNINFVLNTSMTPVSHNNEIDFFHNGKDFFDKLICDIKNAKESIHLQFFIFKSDQLGNRIKDELIKKAQEGVKVRIIIDSVGSIGRISRKYKRDLNDNGIEFHYFLDPFSVLNNRLVNFRNHRKIVVIDSAISYSGGMNLGQEYIDGGKSFDYWRDCHFRIFGEATSFYNNIFYIDWKNSGGKDFQLENKTNFPILNSGIYTQVIYSGPDTDHNSIEMLFLSLISNATETICIESPYFIPTETMVTALKTAALSGVDVKIIIAGKPDKKIPYFVAETYFEELIDCGINIYRYQKGFLHSKIIVVDGKISTVGTCNFDIRSFQLNYEVNGLFYDKQVSKSILTEIELDIIDSTAITIDIINNYSTFRKILASSLRVLSPLL